MRRHSALVTLAVASALAGGLTGCGSEGLVPDVTLDGTDNQTPNTDTRTVDPPTISNLPITQP